MFSSFLKVVKAASPALLRVIAMGAFLIYCTVSIEPLIVNICYVNLLFSCFSFFFMYLDYRHVPSTFPLHMRCKNLASRDRIFSHLWCFDVENMEVGFPRTGKVFGGKFYLKAFISIN